MRPTVQHLTRQQVVARLAKAEQQLKSFYGSVQEALDSEYIGSHPRELLAAFNEYHNMRFLLGVDEPQADEAAVDQALSYTMERLGGAMQPKIIWNECLSALGEVHDRVAFVGTTVDGQPTLVGMLEVLHENLTRLVIVYGGLHALPQVSARSEAVAWALVCLDPSPIQRVNRLCDLARQGPSFEAAVDMCALVTAWLAEF